MLTLLKLYFNNLSLYLNIIKGDMDLIQEIKQMPSVSIIHQPNTMIYLGLIIAIISGIYFGRLMQTKLLKYETQKISPLPLASFKTIFSWASAFIGLTILFTGALEILDFSFIKSLISSIVISLLSGLSMWKVINDLMIQIDAGEIKEIDEYF